MKLLCDEMLAGLARWLRAAGHDAALAESGRADDALLDRADREARVLLTRDRGLAARETPGRRVLLLPEPLDAQAHALARTLGLDWLEAPFTRCLVDNHPLVPASPAAIAALPERSRALPGPFLACPACGRTYWPGSHVRRMRARLARWHAAFRPAASAPGPA
jgi:uncharacterized protein with PIN domain